MFDYKISLCKIACLLVKLVPRASYTESVVKSVGIVYKWWMMFGYDDIASVWWYYECYDDITMQRWYTFGAYDDVTMVFRKLWGYGDYAYHFDKIVTSQWL